MSSYKAFYIEEKDGAFTRRVADLQIADLPQDQVLIRVSYSALNYKDALSSSGHKGITRKFPHTPGIDAVGVVEKSSDERWKKGDKVIVTSYDLGMNTPGGFGQYISIPADWPVALPEGMSEREAMIFGTSAFTAALALYKMEQAGQNPKMGPVLVTGATGAVGTAAIALLASRGYSVTASSGKKEYYEALKALGANQVVGREAVNDESNKPFLSPKWAGAIDTIGGNTLETILKASMLHANVAVCGLVASPNFSTTVYPFIIKGNNLLGIESATIAREIREDIWRLLGKKWKFSLPEKMIREVDLTGLSDEIDRMLSGQSFGKVILKH